MAGYDAFISYSHTKDKPIAAALQSVVQKLGKPWYRRRALRVFRDDTSLSATPSLWPSIEQALGQSRFFILLASPEAAASQWVHKEVTYWLEHNGPGTLLIAVTDGELVWDDSAGDFRWCDSPPLPPVLTGRFATEPKWVDLRAYRDGANPRNAQFIERGADFAAAIHGVPKEDLLSQEVRQQRRAVALVGSAAGSLLILAAAVGWQWREADFAKRHAERNFVIAKQAADGVVFRIAGDLRNVQGMKIESLRRILDAAQTLIDELARAAPEDLELQASRAAMFGEFLNTYFAAGDLARAGIAAEEALTIRRQIAGVRPSDAESQRNLSVALEKLGKLKMEAGDQQSAHAAYTESLSIMRRLAAADPGNVRWQHDSSVLLNLVGDTLFPVGDRDGARKAYEESLAIMRRITWDLGRNNKFQYDLGWTLSRIGDLERESGNRETALAAFEESVAILRKVTTADPTDMMMQHDLGTSLNRLGDLRKEGGDREGALAAYEESLARNRQIVATDPDNAVWQHGLSIILIKISGMQSLAGNREAELAANEESLAILRELATSDPSNTRVQSDMAMILFLVAGLWDRERAFAGYQESVAIMRRLVAANPGHAQWQERLVSSLMMLASLQPDARRARAVAHEALAILEKNEGTLTAGMAGIAKLIRDDLKSLPPD